MVAPLVRPKWSEMVNDHFGINSFFHYESSAIIYSQHAAVADKILELGPRHIRNRIPNTGLSANQLIEFPRFAAAGMKIHSSIGTAADLPMSAASIDTILDEVYDHPTWFYSVSNVNEPNALPGDWQTLVINHQKLIRARLDAKTTSRPNGLSWVKLYGPSLHEGLASTTQDYADMAASDIGNYMDYGDYHLYSIQKTYNVPSTNTPTPSFWQSETIEEARVSYLKSSAAQVVCTEGGYRTVDPVSAAVDGNRHIPYSVDGAYRLRGALELFNRGIHRFYQFEIMDDPDPTDIAPQANYGFVGVPDNAVTAPNPAAWVDKPGFTAMKNFYAATSDRGDGWDALTNPWTPPLVRFEILASGGNSSYLRHTLMAKRDGTVLCAFWLDMPLWNVANHTAVTPPTAPVTIESNAGIANYTATAWVQLVEVDTTSAPPPAEDRDRPAGDQHVTLTLG